WRIDARGWDLWGRAKPGAPSSPLRVVVYAPPAFDAHATASGTNGCRREAVESGRDALGHPVCAARGAGPRVRTGDRRSGVLPGIRPGSQVASRAPARFRCNV